MRRSRGPARGDATRDQAEVPTTAMRWNLRSGAEAAA